LLFNSARPHGIEDCVKSVEGKIPLELGVQLLAEFTTEEVNSALLQMAPKKALGPDEFSANLYQQH
jgi:hypothetical protein